MTSTVANRLLLSRAQLSTICHGDAESIRQLERLLSVVQVLSAPTTSAPTANADLSAGDAVLSRAVTPGRYLIRGLVLSSGSASMDLGGTATLASSTLSLSVAIAGISVDPTKSSETGTLYSGSDNIIVSVEGVVTVTASGSYGITITGTGAVALGSYFSATRLT